MILTGLSTLSLLLSASAQLLKNGGLTDERPSYDSPESAEYQLVEPKLRTPWTEGVAADPENAWAEYPRPLLRRDADDEWLNLNGVWEFQTAESDSESVPSNQTLEQRILVPFCIESGLSGIALQSNYSWYRKEFTVPETFDLSSKNVILHFAAVDYKTTVYVNGEQVGEPHVGGYDKFNYDITSYLNAEGDNELIVFVYDPTNGSDEVIPLGKQVITPSHIFYTPCSGIWQTVSLEAVASEEYITDVKLLAEADGTVTASVLTSGNSSDTTVEIAFSDDSFTTSGSVNTPFNFTFPSPKTWSVESPNLYNITLKLSSSGDEVKSYVGFRTVKKENVGGVDRFTINGEPVFQIGPLDQGYWPDGLHSPPSYEAMIFDIDYLKDVGFNFLRKHIKVEPDLFYAYADKVGILVMQDMPALQADLKPNEEQQAEWERQMDIIFKAHAGFPSVTSFVIYNEGWGQLETGPEIELTPYVASYLNGHQLINAVTGWNDYGQKLYNQSVGDFHDNHHYSSPQCGTPFSSLASLPYWDEQRRIGFQGEFGGVGVNASIENMWNDPISIRDIPQTYEIDADVPTWNYRALKVIEELREQTELFSCSGGVYTQTTDVEGEVNGFLTYDRVVDRLDREKWSAALQAIYDTFSKRIEADKSKSS